MPPEGHAPRSPAGRGLRRFVVRRKCAEPSKAEGPWRAAEAIFARLVAEAYLAGFDTRAGIPATRSAVGCNRGRV